MTDQREMARHLDEIAEAAETLLAAIDAARCCLPRGDGAHEAEQNLLARSGTSWRRTVKSLGDITQP